MDLSNNKLITNEGIQHLTNLTLLDLSHYVLTYNEITNEGIQQLTNLTSLDLCVNYLISNEGIQQLTNLTSLILCANE